MFRAGTSAWYDDPENIALIVAGSLICFLFSLVMQNNFEMQQMREYFGNMATTDALTRVYNRRYIDENIDRLVKSISRANGVLSLMMIDLDFFRRYNDAFGHSKGDTCLKMIAGVLNDGLKRDNDFVARYGGEEFVAILPNTDEKGACMIADRLLANIKDCNIPHEKSEIADHVTVSIGVTTGGKDFTHTGDDYIKKAEEALSLSKQNGRNRYTLLAL